VEVFKNLYTRWYSNIELSIETNVFERENFLRNPLTNLGKTNYIRHKIQNIRRKAVTTAKKSNLSASLEDYLEAIFNLASESDVARSKDIAELLNVSKSSVTGALRVLKKKGLANYKPYDFVTLTDAGQAAAAEVVKKHNILKSFFINVLGVEKDIAQQAACKAEHTLGPEVIARLLSFIEFVAKNGEKGYRLADKFKKFYRNSKKRGKKQENV
jgi:DtxR family Mn-dependent transcriptional regulator